MSVTFSPNCCLGKCFQPESASCFTGIVTKIIDGDTLEVGEAGYKEATELTSELSLIGLSVLVEQDDGQAMDDFGRMMAKVTCEGKLIINEELHESRYAEVMREYCDERES